MTKRNLSPAMTAKFVNLLGALSPENLMADGERPAAAARRIERNLKAQWRALEQEVGRPVTDYEVWAAFIVRPRNPVAHTYSA